MGQCEWAELYPDRLENTADRGRVTRGQEEGETRGGKLAKTRGFLCLSSSFLCVKGSEVSCRESSVVQG